MPSARASPGECRRRRRRRSRRRMRCCSSSMRAPARPAPIAPSPIWCANRASLPSSSPIKARAAPAQAGALEAYALGLGEPVAISAEHGEGLADLYDALRAALPERRTAEAEPRTRRRRPEQQPIRIAIVGRPNTGKSTLINRLLGEDRLLTGPEAGITRDAIAVDLTWQEQHVPRSRHRRLAPPLADRGETRKAFGGRHAQCHPLRRSGHRAHRCADAVRGAGHPHRRSGRARRPRDRHRGQQMGPDRAGARRAVAPARRGRSHVAADQGRSRRSVGQGRPGCRSADGSGDEGPCGLESPRADGGAQSLPGAAITANPPPSVSGRRLRLDYITQPKARPPTFVLFSSRPNALPETYRRYLVNGLRENFALPGTPIRLTLRAKANPYAGRKRRR